MLLSISIKRLAGLAMAVVLGCFLGKGLSAKAAVAIVSVQNDQFVPATTNIHVGDSVVWRWDGNDHNVTSTSSPPAWTASPTENTPFSFTNTFTAAGSFPYECTIHAAFGMLGTIKVTVAPSPPVVSITNPASGALLAAPATVTIGATATNSGGTITNVQFLVGSSVLANLTAAPFVAVTNNLPAGSYTIWAIASASDGLKATNTVSIQVYTPISLGSAILPSPSHFQFSYSADIGSTYVVQVSSNLVNWVSLSTNVASANAATFLDSQATNSASYYRVQLIPNP